MLQTRVIPCLLLRDGRLVKTIQFKNPQYIGDPINAVKIFNELEVDELLFLDISATIEKRDPDLKIIEEIANECFMPFAYGGGISTVAQVKKILSIGVEKVIIDSYALENPKFITEIATQFGNQAVVVAVDVRKTKIGGYEIYSRSGTKLIGKELLSWLKEIEELGAGEICINAIDRDGTWQGLDATLIKQVCNAVSVPVIACGGAGSIRHLSQALAAGASAVGIGSMVVYQAKDMGVLISFPEQPELKKLYATKT